MPIDIPKLDAEDESERVAHAIDALEVTDRNPSSAEVKLIEGIGTFWALLSYFADQLSPQLKLKLFERVGLYPAPGESIEELEARAHDALISRERAISADSFRAMAESIEGVQRATVTGASGSVAVFILDDDCNETPDAGLRSDVRQALKAATTPGVAVTVVQAAVRLAALDSVEVELIEGASVDAVRAGIVEAFAAYVDAATWTWGAPLWGNALVPRFAAVQGVARVGDIRVKTSDDYGQSWGPALLINATAAISTPPPEVFSLLHDGRGFPGAPTDPTIILL